jgi:hypothetical protein
MVVRAFGRRGAAGLTSAPVTTAQVIFSIALGLIALLIVFFSLYVASSTMWADRWVGRKLRRGG